MVRAYSYFPAHSSFGRGAADVVLKMQILAQLKLSRQWGPATDKWCVVYQTGVASCRKSYEDTASAGNRARVTSMATMYSATRPLMPLQHFELDELLSTSSLPGGAWRQPLAVHRFGR